MSKHQLELVDGICRDIRAVENINDLRLISATAKRRIELLGLEVGEKLQRGDKVRVSSGNGNIEHGTVTKVNRTRAVVEMRDSTYTVPFSMITKEVANG